MATAKITLIGMYNFDSTIFDSLTLPEGISKDDFISSLLLSAGEFEVLYPDPKFLKFAIQTWGKKWYYTFAKWLEGIKAEWNPIENYDRYEDVKDTKKVQSTEVNNADYEAKRTANLKDTRSTDGTDTMSYGSEDKTTYGRKDATTQTDSAETIRQVSAFDSDSLKTNEKEINDSGSVETTLSGSDSVKKSGEDEKEVHMVDELSQTGTDSNTVKGKISDKNGFSDEEDIHTAHIHGNIGMTQASEMLKNYYEITGWNLYDHMGDLFKRELLICVY